MRQPTLEERKMLPFLYSIREWPRIEEPYVISLECSRETDNP